MSTVGVLPLGLIRQAMAGVRDVAKLQLTDSTCSHTAATAPGSSRHDRQPGQPGRTIVALMNIGSYGIAL